jgi:thiamine biosynthesis protein ThiS
MSLEIVLNGAPRQVAAADIAALVAELRLPEAGLIAEINGRALPREGWGDERLAPGDRVELVRLMGGG